MEFVLVTTTSTPNTSRSGSVMKFGDYREDEQKISEETPLPVDEDFLDFDSDSNDEDKALLEGFNVLSARHQLVSYDHCTKITFDQEQQKGLQLEVGIHVSEENPWKQIRKGQLLDYIPDEADSPEIIEFRMKLNELDDDASVLVGFAAAITDIEETNAFLLYAGVDSTKECVTLIQQLEAFERQRSNKAIFKYPRRWLSLGSEIEVDLQVTEKKPKEKVEVEIQRLHTSNNASKPLSFRFAEDVRDGYVELVPKTKFDVVMRSTVSVAVQAAAIRIESEQQTDPTFPSNAWAQYAYELPIEPNQCESVDGNDKTEVDDAREEDEDEEEEDGDFSGKKDVIGPSDAMKELLKVLEFNAIDMYRDDYEHIAEKSIRKYSKPEITEVFCFIDPKRCFNRFVNAFAWHPTLSGIFVASYTYKTLNSFALDERLSNEEMIKNLVMFPNPVLLWSFDDTLYPKLVLESPREVTFLSFCPYDANVLIGGLITGQLIIWDLKGCLDRVENSAALTDKQAKNRKIMHSFMAWSKFVENLRGNVVQPAAISHYELSHNKSITCIKWLNRKHSVASTGMIQESVKPNELFRHFVTASMDGTISFWDLDFLQCDPAEIKRTDTKRKLSIRSVPEEPVSPYEKLNGIFRPIYAITCDQPISSLVFDEGLFRFEPKTDTPSTQVDKRMEFKVIHEQQEKATNRFVVSSLIGSISTFIWEGYLYKEGKPEKAKQVESFGVIHNGPVLCIERNPFNSNVLLSVGQKIFAIWSESNQSVPILWRRRPANITCGQWSPTRISLLFIACKNGNIEIWDVLTRMDDFCISYETSATIITVITQHKLNLPTDILMIADHKANLRAFTLPTSISQPKFDDQDKFKALIESELKRKEKFSEWQQIFSEKNGDLNESKELLREESRRTLESVRMSQPEKEPEPKPKEEKRRSKTGVKLKAISPTRKPTRIFEFSERMHQKWEEMQVKRLIKTLITLKQFNLEQIAIDIKPEKDRIEYNAKKKRAIEKHLKKVHQEINEIRARLTPPKDVDLEAERLKFITNNVHNILTNGIDDFQYDTNQTDLEQKLEATKNDVIAIKWHELLERAQRMRCKLNKSIYEKRRKAYIGKSPQIDHETEETTINCKNKHRIHNN